MGIEARSFQMQMNLSHIVVRPAMHRAPVHEEAAFLDSDTRVQQESFRVGCGEERLGSGEALLVDHGLGSVLSPTGSEARAADGDRGAELSDANESFAHRRATGDAPRSSPRRSGVLGLGYSSAAGIWTRVGAESDGLGGACGAPRVSRVAAPLSGVLYSSKTLMSREQLLYQRCCFVLPADI
jgi:hypothetical protein